MTRPASRKGQIGGFFLSGFLASSFLASPFFPGGGLALSSGLSWCGWKPVERGSWGSASLMGQDCPANSMRGG